MQTYLIHRLTDFIHQKSGITVTIQKIDFRPFTSIILKDVYVADLNNDTLLFAKRISASISEINSAKGLFRFGKAQIKEAKIYLKSDSTGVMNLTALLEKFGPDTVQSVDSGNFKLQIGRVSIANTSFRLAEAKADSLNPGKLNFQNLYLTGLNLNAQDFTIDGDTIQLIINSLVARDHSGFTLDNLRSRIKLCGKFMHFDNLRVRAHGTSLSMNKLFFDYESWKSFSKFTSEVSLLADFEGTYLTTTPLAFIIDGIEKYDLGISLTGTVRGYVNDIRARNLDIGFGAQTRIVANANLTGLPAIDNTLITIDVKHLATTRKDLTLLKENGKPTPLISLPEEFNRLGQIRFSGKFTGYVSDFVTYGTLSTSLGNIDLDMLMKPGKNLSTDFKAKASTKNFKLGQLLDNIIVGNITLLTSASGTIDKKGELRAFTDANIQVFEIKGYKYKDIQISGNLGNSAYVGSVNLNDPNCKLNFLGKVDFSDSIPVFDFSLFAPRVDLAMLNLNKSDSISVASFLLTTKFSGSNLDNSRGEIKLMNLAYRNQRGEFKISDFTITADNTNESKVITLKSDIAEGEIRSRYSFSRFPYYLNKLLARHIPALELKEPENTTKPAISKQEDYNDYLVKFRLKKTQKVTSILAPDFKIAENSTLFGILDPDRETLTFKLKVLDLTSGNINIKDLSIDGETRDSLLLATISTPEINLGSRNIRNLRVNAQTLNNDVKCNIAWNNNTKPTTKGNISLIANFDQFSTPAKSIFVNILPSSLMINDSTWQITPSVIQIDSSAILFNNFNLSSKHQMLSIKGKASSFETDTLALTLKNFDISYFDLYLQSMNYKVKGSINGEVDIKATLGSPNLQANLKIINFTLNDLLVGDTEFSSIWFDSEKRMSIALSNTRADTMTLKLSGNYFAESSSIDINAEINQIKLAHFAPLLEGNVSNLHGFLSGNINLTGTIQKPALNGYIDFQNAGLTIDFLRTTYTLTDRVVINNSNVSFSNFRITDRFKRTALLNGSISTNYFQNINLGLRLNMQNFLCMNTRETDNESFYGTVFASGFVDFSGNPNNLGLSINLKTENKTAVYLPLTSSSSVEQSNFVNFVNNDPDLIEIDEATKPSQESSANINIAMELQVSPEAEVQIIIDKKLGDIIRANGSGNLRMEINPSSDVFRMFGRYTINQGDYLFTLSGVINKRFRIEQGSYIDWNGDPLDATMDISAVYRVKTSLKQLLLDDSYTARVPVDCKIMLTQKLLSPSIKFGIEFPNLDQQTRVMVDGMLNTEEKINTQFLGLLVINSFITDPGMAGGTTTQSSGSNLGTTGLYNTASELLSNQLSNWLSQWSKNFDIGINYRPGLESELSSDQLELAFSTQILDDRVTINSNFDVNSSRNTSSALVGDFNVDVKLSKSGKFRGKAFARNNNDILPSTQQNNYTTGAGIVYREDFNTFRELFNSIFKKNDMEKSQSVNNPLPTIENKEANDSSSSTGQNNPFIKIN